MTVDDSFKKPGAVPFKWEVKPGVPKAMNGKDCHKLHPPTSPLYLSIPYRAQDHSRYSSQLQTQKLKPPPAPTHEVYTFPQSEPRARSFRSAPRIRSERWLFENRPLRRNGPEIVKPGCFFSPWIKRIASKRRKEIVQKPGTGFESDYSSDLSRSLGGHCPPGRLSPHSISLYRLHRRLAGRLLDPLTMLSGPGLDFVESVQPRTFSLQNVIFRLNHW